MDSQDTRGVDRYMWFQTRVWSKSRVTTRCTGRGEVGKMTYQPTVTQTNKNIQSKSDPYLGTCDVYVHGPADCLVAPLHNCCCNPRVIARYHFFFNYPPSYASLQIIATRQHCYRSVCMHGHHQSNEVANPARDQLNRKIVFFPVSVHA